MYRMIAGEILQPDYNVFCKSWFFDVRNICACRHVSIMNIGFRSLEVEEMVDSLEKKGERR